MIKFKVLVIAIIFFQITACAATKDTTEDESRIKTAKINAQLGISYLEKKEMARAKQKLLLALDEGQTIPESWYSMAYFLEVTGDTRKANQYYQHAISLAPNRGDSHNNYGTFLCRGGHYQRAIQQFLLAVNDIDYLSPADAYENAGLCALSAKNETQAKKFFKRAIMQDPNRPVSLVQLDKLEYKQKKFHVAKVEITDRPIRIRRHFAFSPT